MTSMAASPTKVKSSALISSFPWNTGLMDSPKRAATRAATIERIKSTSRALLARHGASGLSLREVAREMNQTSSALYRYFASRDELLTALIVDAYVDLGATAEASESLVDREDLRGRWRAACDAIRQWSHVHPHEYSLIFGSPIPGYEAPEYTIAAATRVVSVIARILNDACQREMPVTNARDDDAARGALEMAGVAIVMPDVPASVAIRGIFAWTQIFGFISFELFGHLVGSIRNGDDAFEQLISATADQVGIRETK